MNTKRLIVKYIIFDVIAAAIAWTAFYCYRKLYIEPIKFGYQIPLEFDNKYFLGLILIPSFWCLLYYVTGSYRNVYRKSRLQELGNTTFITVLGCLLIFFVLILDDAVAEYKYYYKSFFVLLILHFVFTYIPRVIITSITIYKIRNRILGFNTLLIGCNKKALELYHYLQRQEKSSGNNIVGYINMHEKEANYLSDKLKCLGNFDEVVQIINTHNIVEVIIAIESSEQENISKIISKLNETNVIIKVIPNMYDILTGTAKMSSIYSAPLIQISHELLPAWQENIKRIFDIIISIIMIIILSPLYIAIAIGVKLSSKGPILYSHERIGRYGKPFLIYKFRSMYVDAEKNGPELSSKTDKRVTRFGRFLRKWRLDELPQFYNVLIGDMSLVGPRPERQYFIDLITQRAPHYAYLHKVRPGITSWGQVKFGYAENVDQMIERLKYDIIYIENMSLYTDFKILIYTLITLLKGRGK